MYYLKDFSSCITIPMSKELSFSDIKAMEPNILKPDNRGQNQLDAYCMEFSMRVMVRKAARLAVYEEMTIRANIHQTPIIILVARVV